MAKLAHDPNAVQTAAPDSATPPDAPVSTIVQQVDGAAVDPAAETSTEKKLSPKNKLSRGIDPNLKTTWVPLDCSPEDNERLRKVASVRDVKIGDLLAGVLKWGLEQYAAQFDADEARYVGGTGKTTKKTDNMTAEELEAHAMGVTARAEKQMEAAKQMLAQARERAAAARANAEVQA